MVIGYLSGSVILIIYIKYINFLHNTKSTLKQI